MNADWTSLVAASATAFTTLVFARAALHKLGEFTTFTGFVADYQVVPERQVVPVSMGLAAAEVAVVASAFLPRPAYAGRGGGDRALSRLRRSRSGSTSPVVATGSRCGCGGAAQPLSWTLVTRNFVLAAIAAIGLAGPIPALGVAEAVTAIGSGFTLFVGYQLVEQIMANFAHMRLKR